MSTVSGERPMRDPNRGKVEDRAELQREPGTPRVFAPGGVHEQDLRKLGKRAHGRFDSSLPAARATRVLDT